MQAVLFIGGVPPVSSALPIAGLLLAAGLVAVIPAVHAASVTICVQLSEPAYRVGLTLNPVRVTLHREGACTLAPDDGQPRR